jgi:nitrate reductase gamma subunit
MNANDILWTLLSLFFIGLAYFSTFVFILGLAWKLIGYLRLPMPYPHTLTPGPTTEGGAVLRILGDVTIFPNLFKADKWLWAGAIIFHFTLAAILFRHLRYLTYPVPGLVLYMETVALFFASLFGAAILFLFWRRFGLPRTLYISNIPDYFALVLLGFIATTGLMVSYWLHVNIVDVKGFLLGLMTFHPVEIPHHPLFLLHLFSVLILMLYFPFSKLVHAGGVFFSPSRHQPYTVQGEGKRTTNSMNRTIRKNSPESR